MKLLVVIYLLVIVLSWWLTLPSSKTLWMLVPPEGWKPPQAIPILNPMINDGMVHYDIWDGIRRGE